MNSLSKSKIILAKYHINSSEYFAHFVIFILLFAITLLIILVSAEFLTYRPIFLIFFILPILIYFVFLIAYFSRSKRFVITSNGIFLHYFIRSPNFIPFSSIVRIEEDAASSLILHLKNDEQWYIFLSNIDNKFHREFIQLISRNILPKPNDT